MIRIEKSYLFLFIIVLVIILIYSPIFKNDFLYQWDDQWVVMNYYTTGGINSSNLLSILTDFYHGQYAPLNELNYLLLYTGFGYNPFWFHLVSLLWHIMNVLLTFFFIRNLLKLNNRIASYKLIALFTACIWGIHPITVESVAWISASKVLIYTFFYLLASLCYLKYIKTNKLLYYILTFIFFLVSFMGKEQAVVFPLFLFLIDWFVGRDLKNVKLWIEKLPFFVLALVLGLVTILSQGLSSNHLIYPLGQRVAFASYTLFEYLVKCILPVNLLYIYPFPIQVGEVLPFRFYIYPVLITIFAYCVFLLRKQIVLLFVVLFFVIHLLVTLHLIPISRFAIVADRYAYLACLGITFLISYYMISIYEQLRKKKLFIFVVSFYVIYLLGYTNLYSRDWKDVSSLKEGMRDLLNHREQIDK